MLRVFQTLPRREIFFDVILFSFENRASFRRQEKNEEKLSSSPSLTAMSPSRGRSRPRAVGKFREIAGYGLISDRRISELSERRSCRQRDSAELLLRYHIRIRWGEGRGRRGSSLCIPPRVVDIFRTVRIVNDYCCNETPMTVIIDDSPLNFPSGLGNVSFRITGGAEGDPEVSPGIR